MIIRLASLREGLNPVVDSLSPAALDLDETVYRGRIAVSGQVDFSESMLAIRLHLSGQGHFICDRCAVDFDRPFAIDLRLQVFRRDPRDREEAETEGLVFIGPHGREIDITHEIAEEILLDVPMKILCREDCKGLCPNCGADLNEEPCSCRVGG